MNRLVYLCDDIQRYTDIYLTVFYKLAHKDQVLDHVVDKFERHVKKRLVRSSSVPGKTFRLLGIGVGGGQHEFNILKSLSPHFTSVHNIAIEPDKTQLDTFKEKLESCDVTKKVTSDWFAGGFDDFNAQSPLVGTKFDLITSIHSMYYLGPLEDSLPRLMDLINDDGALLIHVATDDAIPMKLIPWTSVGKYHTSTSNKICTAAEKNDYGITRFPLSLSIDVTEVFDEESEYGSKLLDFITQTAYFRATAEKAMLDETLSFLRSQTVEEDGGRLTCNLDEEIIVVTKP